MQSEAGYLDLFVDILVRALLLFLFNCIARFFHDFFSRIEARFYNKKLTKIDRLKASVTVGGYSPIFSTLSAMSEIDGCEP